MNERIIPQDKRQLRDYLKALPLRDIDELEKIGDEILIYSRHVMDAYVRGERGEALRDYYAPAMKMIEDAFAKEDYEKAIPRALEFMIDSVDWE